MSDDKQPLANVEKESHGDNSPSFKAEQKVSDSTGKVLAIVAFGIACVALGMSIPTFTQSRDMRAELLQEIQKSEARVLQDNMEKNTSYRLLDRHVEDLKTKLEIVENTHGKR